MKKIPVTNSSATPSVIKRITIIVGLAIIVSVVVSYALWVNVAAPQNKAAFNQQGVSNLEHYRKRVSAYLVEVDAELKQFASHLPTTIFEASSYNLVVTASVNQQLRQYQSSLAQELPHLNSLQWLSAEKIDILFQSPPQTQDKTTISFLLIDMANRLQTRQESTIEVARVNNTSPWQLHQLIPVNNSQNQPLGALHVTLSLVGVESIFKGIDESLAQYVLMQSIDNEQPLSFFQIGQGSEQYISRTSTITDSYWQISYQPSTTLFETYQKIPVWLYVVGFSLLILLIAVGLLVTRSKASVSSAPSRSSRRKRTALAPVETDKQRVVDNSESTAKESPANQKNSSAVLVAEEEPTIFPDSIFRAYDIRGIAFEQLSIELVHAIGQAVASEALASGETSMIVAHDARTHSPEFAACVIEGITSTGCHVINIGLVPTPMMNFSACQHSKTNSGIIITASHNPKEYNGCKIVVQGQTLVEEDIQRLKQRIIDQDITTSSTKGSVEKDDFSAAYIEKISADLAIMEGWKVVVDAGNGASSELAPRLLNALKCETHTLFCQFDGEFPNHDPDPSRIENLQALLNTVKEKKADIGFAFDGDGDRVMVVTAKGNVVWPDQLLMLFAQDVVARHPGCDVVFDIKSSHLLAQVITQNGGRPVMWKTGHSHIKSKMRETQSLLGGEFSGHIFFKERWFGFDDGLYAAARLLELMTLTGKTIDQMLAELPTMVSTAEIKVSIAEEKKFAFIDQLIQSDTFVLDAGSSEADSGERITFDGLRIDFKNSWGLVRASNTAPALTLRFQAKDAKGLDAIKTLFKRELLNIDKTLTIDF